MHTPFVPLPAVVFIKLCRPMHVVHILYGDIEEDGRLQCSGKPTPVQPQRKTFCPT